MGNRRNCFSPLFHNIYNISLTLGVKLHIHLLNVVVGFIGFLTSATLIFRGTDISKCFRKSLGIRDNKSRLYYVILTSVRVLALSALQTRTDTFANCVDPDLHDYEPSH